MVFEKYNNNDAVKSHLALDQFKALSAKFSDLLLEPPSISFYEEFN